ncbi:MAG: hypothetical protein LWX07_08090 [Bacteroidetes bacterium]|nr:hypothetical protein [Bacteroidota bacterium]
MMKYVFLILISIITIIILWLNFSLVTGYSSKQDAVSDAVIHLNFLETELKQNRLGDRMQQSYPEGFVFINALYGLSWCELALSSQGTDPAMKERALKEALFAYNEIENGKAKLNFDKTLYPEYGIFYFGWKNYLLSKILSIDTSFAGHEKYSDAFYSNCFVLHQIITGKESPYVQSYKGHTWPADMFVAVASLKNYGRIFDSRYEDDVCVWIKKVRDRLDSSNGMIPHKADIKNGFAAQKTRGSSMSLILRLLPEIDSSFAAQQYGLFSKDYVSSFLGLPYLREYPKGEDGIGDVDSGPVVFGIGFSGTVVMTGAYSALRLNTLSENQFRVLNTFGFSTKSGNTKMFLFGKYPMADAFIVWGLTSGLNTRSFVSSNMYFWFPAFTLVGLSILLVLWFPFLIRKKKSSQKSNI